MGFDGDRRVPPTARRDSLLNFSRLIYEIQNNARLIAIGVCQPTSTTNCDYKIPESVGPYAPATVLRGLENWSTQPNGAALTETFTPPAPSGSRELSDIADLSENKLSSEAPVEISEAPPLPSIAIYPGRTRPIQWRQDDVGSRRGDRSKLRMTDDNRKIERSGLDRWGDVAL